MKAKGVFALRSKRGLRRGCGAEQPGRGDRTERTQRAPAPGSAAGAQKQKAGAEARNENPRGLTGGLNHGLE
jgi:hypothetical protein